MTLPSDVRVTLELGSRRVQLSGADFDRPGYRVVRGFLASLLGWEEGTTGMMGLSPSPNANASDQRVLFHERSGGREGVQGKPSGEPHESDADNFAGYLADAFDDRKSLAWYRHVAAALPRASVLDALQRARDAINVRRSRAALFTSIVRPLLRSSKHPCPPETNRDESPE